MLALASGEWDGSSAVVAAPRLLWSENDHLWPYGEGDQSKRSPTITSVSELLDRLFDLRTGPRRGSK